MDNQLHLHKKASRKLLFIVLAFFLMCFCVLTFSGCFQNSDAVIKNGHYKLTEYSINGVSQTNYVGQYARINGYSMTDWLGNTTSIEIKGKSCSFNWKRDTANTIVLTGKFSKDVISINCTIQNTAYIMVLEYEQDVVMKNGHYKVTAYSVNGISKPNDIGQYVKINGNVMTTWLNNNIGLEIKGKSCFFTWDGENTVSGSVVNDVITVNSSNNNAGLVLTLKYEQDVVMKNGHYKITAYSIDGISQPNAVGQYIKINGNVMTDWLNDNSTFEIKGMSYCFRWNGESSVSGSVSNDVVTVNTSTNSGELVMIFEYEEDVVIKNGNYRITAYSLDGVSQTHVIGQYVRINDNSMTNWFDNTTRIDIKGKSCFFRWGSVTPCILTGVVSNDVISVDCTANDTSYTMVLQYEP